MWLRRPGTARLPEELTPEERDWLRLECGDFLGAIWANLDTLWVSAPDRLRRASLKLLQLRLAGELGFRVPRFTCTNDPARARAFIDAHPGGVITKVLTNPTLQTSDRAAMIYTHLLTGEDEAQLDSVRHGPTFLQEFVRKRRDLRVTVIGDELFAVGIDSAGDREAAIDFRRGEIFDLPHEPLALPPSVHDACLALVRRLGLQFGAIDLLLTAEGEYVFLEINPNGQPLAVADASRDPRQAADIAERVGYRPDSILCVPLVHDDRVCCVLEMLDKEAGDSFSLEDLATLGLFANQAVIALVQAGGRDKTAALLVELLRSSGALGGGYGEDLLERLGRFAARLDAEDASWRQALDLAGRVWVIASRDEEAARGCRALLDAVATLVGGAHAPPAGGGCTMSDFAPTAYSAPFARGRIRPIAAVPPLDDLTDEWAWGGGTERA